MIVYHGTHRAFVELIRDVGLVPPKGHGIGVRVRLDWAEAIADAKAWSAYVTFRDQLPPVGMVVVAAVPDEDVRADRHGTLRVSQIPPMPEPWLQLRGPFDFVDEMFDEVAGPQQPFFDALAEWERLTDNRLNVPLPRRGVRRS